MLDGKAFHGMLTDVARFADAGRNALPALACVRIRPGVVDGAPVIVAEATDDRFALAEAWIPIDPDADAGQPLTDPVCIPLDGVKRMIATLKGATHATLAVEYRDTGSATVTVSDYSTTATVYCPNDGEFPSVERLWAPIGEDRADVVGLAGENLLKVANVSKRRKRSAEITTGANSRKPMRVTIGEDFRALVMPTRIPDDNPTNYSVPDTPEYAAARASWEEIAAPVAV